MEGELRKAERLLSSRGLVFSARWAAELLFAVATGGAESPHQPPPEKEEEDPRVLFARTLLATREYRRAAAALADAQGPAALFVRCYARFLALSQAQNARRPDLCASDTAVAACVTSAELRELAEIADALRAAAESDALCGYLCGVALRAADRRSDARACLADSISRFPLNASAWAEFAACCDGFDEAARLLPRAHWSADFAIAKAASELQAPAAARETLCRLLQRFPRSLYVKRELAAALCAGREHAEAERLLLEVRAEDPLCLEGIDTLSNLLYLRDDHATLSALARDAARIDPTRAESLVAAGNYLSLVVRVAPFLALFLILFPSHGFVCRAGMKKRQSALRKLQRSLRAGALRGLPRLCFLDTSISNSKTCQLPSVLIALQPRPVRASTVRGTGWGLLTRRFGSHCTLRSMPSARARCGLTIRACGAFLGSVQTLPGTHAGPSTRMHVLRQTTRVT